MDNQLMINFSITMESLKSVTTGPLCQIDIGIPVGAQETETRDNPLPGTGEAGSAPLASPGRSRWEKPPAHFQDACDKRSPEQRIPAKLRAEELESLVS